MNIGGIGNTGTDYSRYATRQLEQEAAQQESAEQQAEQAAVVQQSAQSQAPETNTGNSGQAQTQASEAAAISSGIAEALTTESDDGETGNQTLINKANSGAELTQSELSALKDIDPALYAQAIKAKVAREDLRSQMSQRPASAMRTAHEAISKYLDSEGEDTQSMVRKALSDEYKNFSSKYDQAEFSGHLYEI